MFKPRMIIKKGAALKQESVLESQTMQAENQRQLSSEEIRLRPICRLFPGLMPAERP